MATLYIVSTEAHSGKTGLCLSLGLDLIGQGFKVGYMKPLGTLPGRIDDALVDLDAYYVWKRLETGDDMADVSPVIMTKSLIKEHLKGESVDFADTIASAYGRIAEGKDIVLLENGADLNEGRFIGVSAVQLAERLETRVLILARYRSELIIDDVLEARDMLGERLMGVIFNQVSGHMRETVDLVVDYLAKRNIRTYGILPRDSLLRSVSVDEIAAHLNGTILTAVDRTGELVENFMVGAMGQEKALRFFQRTANKAVITGGDRADVQLAALETPTKALILTGSMQPSPIVMARAEEKGIPMILVDFDTLTAVEKTDELVGRVRVHQDKKVQRFRGLIKEGVDLAALYADAGISGL